MNQLVLVQIGDCAENLSNDLSCILLSQEHSTINIFIDLTEEVATLAKLSDDKKSFLVLVDLLEAEHVGMV